MLKKSVIHLLAVSVATVILTACGSSKSAGNAGVYTPAKPSWPAPAETAALAPQSQALLSAAHTWLGVPYKYGGNDRKGVDCSGLVLQVYKDALGIPLPRNSAEQRDYCTAIAKGSLIPGDLIFFATGKDKNRVSHVGIFIGDNLMIHASSSQGVILSDINSQYYARTYAGSGIVDQYHSMIGDTRRKPKKGIKPAKPGKQVPSSQEGPVIHIPQSESVSAPAYTLTPVESLPVKADTTATTATATPQPVTTATTTTATTTSASGTTATTTNASTATTAPVKTATVSTAQQAEPTPEEARAAVLNAIKEKEL